MSETKTQKIKSICKFISFCDYQWVDYTQLLTASAGKTLVLQEGHFGAPAGGCQGIFIFCSFTWMKNHDLVSILIKLRLMIWFTITTKYRNW